MVFEVMILLDEDIRKPLAIYAASIGAPVKSMKYNKVNKKLTLYFEIKPTPAQIADLKSKYNDFNKAKKFENIGNFDQFMIDLTPAQAEAYIDANVTNLAEANEFLKRLTKAVLFLYDKL